MDQAGKIETLRQLQSGRDSLREALAGVDDAMAAHKPSPDSWSIRDCVEHMVVTERYLLTRLQAAEPCEQPFEKSRREDKIARLAADRSRRIEAPEQAQPRGRFATLREALAAFDAARAEVMEWVEKATGDPRCMLTDHPLIAGPVTCAETLIMIAAHPARHSEQIIEIRRTLDPGK
jgi:uncharacterized damage-inducible protein DinB